MNALPKQSHPKQRWAILGIIAVLSFPRFAMGDEKCGSLERAQTSVKMIWTLYPNLRGKDFNVAFARGMPSGGGLLTSATDVRSLRITLDKPEWAVEGTLSPPSTLNGEVEYPLSFNFGFIEADYPEARVVCRPVEFSKNTDSRFATLRQTINAHSAWTDAQILAAARQAGMHFGPDKKAGILRAFPLRGLTALYGPIRRTKIVFDIYNGEKCDGCSFAGLTWYIEMAEVGTARKLRIYVEPFEARITSVTEFR